MNQSSTFHPHSLPVVVPGPGEPQTTIYPAITHFTDAISALPRDFQRHASLLKEVDSKAWRLEEVLGRQLTQAADVTPFEELTKEYLKDPENGAKVGGYSYFVQFVWSGNIANKKVNTDAKRCIRELIEDRAFQANCFQ